ncbi:MAG: quinolinate synthase [Thermodesulfovibrionales bacterium]|nr:quinolinate synthase [Thermodesulfovibrionales bacterium]
MKHKELVANILRLKDEKRAIILAHNYQRPEVQDIADHVGDSLELSRIAAGIDCDVIVFCGVHFMAESASILSPQKTVLLPEISAGCPMADMITTKGQRKMPTSFHGYDEGSYTFPKDFTLMDIKNMYPNAPVVAYVNTSAEVKAESDICCTSANVINVVNSLNEDTIISIPDRNLSMWAQKHSSKRIITWDGFCHVHDRVRKEDVIEAKKIHKDAVFVAHPECRIEVLEMADKVASTSGMIRYTKESSHKEFIIGTEIGIIHRLQKESPEKRFYPLRKDMICPNMKKTNLQNIYEALNHMKYIVKVPEDIRQKAKISLDRMLTIK